MSERLWRRSKCPSQLSVESCAQVPCLTLIISPDLSGVPLRSLCVCAAGALLVGIVQRAANTVRACLKPRPSPIQEAACKKQRPVLFDSGATAASSLWLVPERGSGLVCSPAARHVYYMSCSLSEVRGHDAAAICPRCQRSEHPRRLPSVHRLKDSSEKVVPPVCQASGTI